MTTGLLIDSSVGLAWVHQDQARPDTDKLLGEVEAGAHVVVLSLWFLEIANCLLVLQRRKRLTSVERKSALESLARLNLTVDEEAGRVAFQLISELAEKHGLTIYDATYLEVALRQRLALASRDMTLRAAAKRYGLKVL